LRRFEGFFQQVSQIHQAIVAEKITPQNARDDSGIIGA
jgi:hypothetical protein